MRMVTITTLCAGWKDNAGQTHKCGKKIGEWQEEDRGEDYYRRYGRTSHGYCEACYSKQLEADEAYA